MNKSSIPGYTYDETKKRFFKIERGTLHSQDNVKRLKETAEEKMPRWSGRRHKILTTTQQRLTLGRELGSQDGLEWLQTQVAAQRIDLQESLIFDSGTGSEISEFAMTQTGRIYVGSYDGLLCEMTGRSTVNYCYRFASEITSVSVNDRAVATTCFGNEFSPGSLSVASTDHCNDGGMVYFVMTPNKKKSIWCAKIAQTDCMVAMGATKACLIVKEHAGAFHFETFPSTSDVFSVDHLDPHVVVAGGRDGTCRQIDQRLPTSHATDTILRHPSAISKVRAWEHQYLVAGIRGNLSLYDARMIRQDRLTDTLSLPIQSYVHHKNEYQVRLGLDVHPQLNIFAASGDDTKIRFWHLSHAEPLRELDLPSDALLQRPFSRALTFDADAKMHASLLCNVHIYA